MSSAIGCTSMTVHAAALWQGFSRLQLWDRSVGRAWDLRAGHAVASAKTWKHVLKCWRAADIRWSRVTARHNEWMAIAAQHVTCLCRAARFCHSGAYGGQITLPIHMARQLVRVSQSLNGMSCKPRWPLSSAASFSGAGHRWECTICCTLLCLCCTCQQDDCPLCLLHRIHKRTSC